MTTRDHLIRKLKELCNTHGGPITVADEAKVSAENLKQIIAGTQLPSGQPRGVGPNLQRKLDARYPGWSGLEAAAPSMGSTGIALLIDTSVLRDLEDLPPNERQAFVLEIRERADAYRNYLQSALERMKQQQAQPPPPSPPSMPRIEAAPAMGSELLRTSAQKRRSVTASHRSIHSKKAEK